MAKTKLTIKLKVSELVYDVQNRTDLTGQARYDGKNDEFVAKLRMNDDEENANQVLRSITTAYGRLKTKLSEYISVNDSFSRADGTLNTLVYDAQSGTGHDGTINVADYNGDGVRDSADNVAAIKDGINTLGDISGDGEITESDMRYRQGFGESGIKSHVVKVDTLGVVGGSTVASATLASDDWLCLFLTLPSNYNHAADDDVAQAAHNYIVNYAIFDWFRIVDKDDAKDYLDLSEANILQIREAINKRIRPTRVSS